LNAIDGANVASFPQLLWTQMAQTCGQVLQVIAAQDDHDALSNH
jgi:hypothetical protein